jgi:hypothetical protein
MMGTRKMVSSNITISKLEFLNRECKNNEHYECIGRWQGLGFKIYCSCDCHHKKEEALESVGGPVANAIHDVQPISLGDTQG